MDVQIDSRRIVAERENRAWSQQHLSEAAGLALRTIQRIEARGTGSYESAKAIASCLGMSVADLRASDKPERSHILRSRVATIGGSLSSKTVRWFWLSSFTSIGSTDSSW